MEEIKLCNCSKTYQKNGKNIQALKKINYTFNLNSFYAIMGESGSGKSTLINIIAGLLNCDEGQILYDKKEVKNNLEMAKIRNKNIGLVYQSYLLNDYMTSLENVMLPLFINKSLKKREREQKASELLNHLGLKNRLKHYPKELSGGEQQRVAIARALINNPDFILADEPTGNLDKKNENYIFNLFKKQSENGKCVIVVSHNEKIKQYADKVLLLKDGELSEDK